MKINKKNLIWIDLEMTGLNLNKDHIIEIATLVTNDNLEILEEGPCLAIHQKSEILNSMNEWNKNIHIKNGLIDKVKKSFYNVKKAELSTINFLKKWIPSGYSPMCGSSVSNDRFFLSKYMPNLLNYFHYRSIDVSSLKELFKIWRPNHKIQIKKLIKHKAINDIYNSINELVFYRDNFIKIKK